MTAATVVVTVSVAAAQRAGGWPGTVGLVAVTAYAGLALTASVLFAQLYLARRALRSEIARLERDVAALRRRTAGLAHDMRAPMVTVSSYLDLLAAGEFGTLPTAAQHAAGQAARAAVRARLLVDATLAASVGDGDEPCTPATIVDLNAVLSDVAVSLAADISRTQASVTVAVLPMVTGNESAYYRIFENLMQNSLRYARPGDPPRIEVSASEGRYGIELSVRDYGSGISPADHDRVFTARVRGANATAEATGLGLATVRELVTGVGGAVWIDPGVTDGVCVRLRVPPAVCAVQFARV